ncbi:hypothetical protein ON010_g3976 [Phytophthora cinnamomi]|nr:hypothetical protein ON010_g3976 [Phytophthora cinnamomi]
MSSSLTQSASAPVGLREQEANEELSAWKRETRYYLLKDVNSAIDYAAHELERIDFIWGRIRSDRGAASPAIKADIRVEVRLDPIPYVLDLVRPPRGLHQGGAQADQGPAQRADRQHVRALPLHAADSADSNGVLMSL